MAHLRALTITCSANGCSKRATCELFNRWNSPNGKYCRPCGTRLLRSLESSEQSTVCPYSPTAKPSKGSPF